MTVDSSSFTSGSVMNPLLAAGKTLAPIQSPDAGFAEKLYNKITDSLASDREKFLRLQAFELKKRAEFYQNFAGSIGDNAYNDIAHQAKSLVAEFLKLKGA